ncbi:general substrate transporter [Backusella circina FSU 941]|nr:general substrate transporter [Backusella circina FSU 941]
MPTFPTYFEFGSDPTTIADMKGNVVSLLQAGCAVGCIVVIFMADPLGRKKSVLINSGVFVLGAALQAAAKNLSTMLAGRFIAGLGIGACSSLVPMYIAEIAPVEMRGRLGTIWQLMTCTGIMVSYWIDYACLRGIAIGDNQWRVPLAIQAAPGAILFFAMLPLPESIRWYVNKDRHEDALRTLCKIRDLPESHPSIQQEYKEILDARDMEKASNNTLFQEIFQRHNLHRLFIGCALQSFQQWTGTNAINYYAPDIFKSIGLDSNETDILATGVYGAVKVIFVFVSLFIVDTRLGRRRTLFIGSFIMMAAFYILGGCILAIQKENNGAIGAGAAVGAKGYVAMVMIYMFAVGYETSWGPLVWICCSEIYSSRLRGFSVSFATAFNWGFNAVIAKVTPIMIHSISYGTYFFFGSCAILMGIFVYFFVPETKGRSLEDIDKLFKDGMILAYKDNYKIGSEANSTIDEESISKL